MSVTMYKLHLSFSTHPGRPTAPNPWRNFSAMRPRPSQANVALSLTLSTTWETKSVTPATLRPNAMLERLLPLSPRLGELR